MQVSTKKTDKLKPKPDEGALDFGTIFTDHMFNMDYSLEKGWHNPRIEPYRSLVLDPACLVLHYGQGIFEGLKAYHARDGRILMFRPEENAQRMNRSAERMCMATLDVDFQVKAIEELVRLEEGWIPRSPGTSLYIRPTMIASEAALGPRPAKEYIYYVITGPVGAYYPEGFNPTRIFVSDQYVRAVRGGVGEAKTMGNYAASLMAATQAKKLGCSQVLYLDALELRYAEEVGTSNIFFRIGDELATPALGGTILPGVTRDSIIKLARHWGITVNERPIAIDEVLDAAQSGQTVEAFGSGTAAVVSPIGEFYYKGKSYPIGGGRVGEWTQRLYDELVGIQYGEKEDLFGWVRVVKK